ncbi:MAG: ABC transporter permease [Agathobaculum sp.]|jgi:ribose/xylose/arabinose/galactoside ABC-type transport system permease subunit|uniref:ABC transporter permease n=1 Tax=Agathobaculum sp. TaxID=2048138 RepID=UPI003D92E1A7
MKSQSAASRRLQSIVKEHSAFFILLALILAMSLLRGDAFLKTTNLVNIVRQQSVIGIIALGIMFPIVSGGTDLSGGSVVALCSVFAALSVKAELPIPVVFVIATAIGALTGVINGFFIAYGNVPPFIATLGMMSIARGAALLITDSKNINGFYSSFERIGKDSFLGVPIAAWIFFLMAVLIYILLERTKYGTSIYAIGGNATAARVSGINVAFCKFMAYVTAGACTGIAAVVLTSRMRSGNPSVGVAYEMDAITCVILGGASFSGGSGKVINTVFGALILGILVNGMTMLRIDSNLQNVVKGAVIVIAVFLDSRKRTE